MRFQMSAQTCTIVPGQILWLRRDADRVDPNTFKLVGLSKGALDHPVVVVEDRLDQSVALVVPVGRSCRLKMNSEC